MVQQITAFQASDGVTFPNKRDALIHDAKQQLLTISGMNPGIVSALLSNRVVIVEALQPLIDDDQPASEG